MAGALALSVLVVMGRSLVSRGNKPDDSPDAAGITAAQAMAEGPDMPPNMNQVTATFVQKVATGIFGTSLSADQQYVAGMAWHLTYGGFWGMCYALLQSSLRAPRLVLGPAYGVAVWAIGFAWLVPKMKLILLPREQRRRITALAVGVHAAYGAIVALVFHVIEDRD
jgi:hypothetical protein